MSERKHSFGWRFGQRFVGRVFCLVAGILLFASPPASAATMQAMDLTTFTEADSGSNITVTASAVAFTNIETRKSISYVYKSQTHPGDFAYEFDTIVTAADTSAGPFLIWGVTNSTAKTYDNWTDGFFLGFNKTSSGMTLRFLDSWLDYEEATGFALNTRYYFRVSRTGTAITAKVYTDAAKTVLKATLVRNAVDDNNTISYNNLYAFATDDNTLTTRKATGDVRNLAVEVASLPGPAAPVLNSATAGNAKVTLVWGSVSGATGYKVKYGTTSGSYPTTLDVGNVTTKDVTGLNNGQAYYFVVTAYNANGESGVSNERSATPIGQPGPSAPVLNSATAGNAKVTLAWGSVSGATGYKVKYGTGSGSYSTTVDVGNVLTRDVTGLTNSQAYYFVVTAYNANGESIVSNERSATPVVPPLPDQTAVVTDVIYNASGQITILTYGNGTVIDYTYNPLNLRLTNLKTTAPGGTVIQDLSYTYDSVGNILSINDAVNTADQTFEYDHLNRLTKATGQTYGAKTYTYDEIGNIVSKEGVSYVYGENGAGPHAVTHLSDGTAFTYDTNGNMATKVKAGVTTAYTYDAENRLINIKKNGALVSEYEYDGDGGRTKKKVYGATSTVTTEFIGSLFEKEDGHVSRHVFFGDKKVATVKDGTLVYTFDDHLGGANVITDASGTVKEIAEYTPFGTFARHDRQGSTDLTQNFFTGQRLDPEDGLYYYGARYYSPEIGRFITPDTVVQTPNDPQTLNRYTYCGNNPVNFVDPTGHFFWAAIVLAVKAIAAATTAVVSATAAYVTANAAAIATGALVGGAVGGISSAAMGGNFWQGAGIGALGGAVFAGLVPGFNIISNGLARGITLGGAAGPLAPGAAMASNFAAGFLGGAASGAAVAGVSGADVSDGALFGGAIAGGFSLVRSIDQIMWSKMQAQSARGPLNSEVPGLPKKGGVGKYGGTPMGGNRFDQHVLFSKWVKNPSPLGGLQGSTGKFLFFNYSGDSVWHKIVETYAGAHDFLNSWAYDDATGYMRNLNGFERAIGGITNPLNVVIATPIAVPSALPQTLNSAPTIVYGLNNE